MKSSWYSRRTIQKPISPKYSRAPRVIPRSQPMLWWKRILNWINDKDARSTGAWGVTTFGSIMIGGYFLWLGFTPVFSLGQATLLLVQAFAVGTILTVYFSLLLLSPAWGYRLLGIEIEDFGHAHRKKAISSLTLRSIAAQTLAVSFLYALNSGLSLSSESGLNLYCGLAIALFAGSAVVIYRLPFTTEFGGTETRVWYFGSVVVLGLSGLVSTTMVYLAYSIAPKGQRAESWSLLLGWIIVMVVSAGISTLRKKDRRLGLVMGFFVFLYVLYLFNNITMPFKGTAFALGIAEPRAVTLILTPSTCAQVKQVLFDQDKLNCDGPATGRLTPAMLMNTLGERWVLREVGHEENITFDGKGTVVRKLPQDTLHPNR